MVEPWMMDTLEKFARYVGIDHVQIPENNVVCFDFEKSGRLFIEFYEDKVFLYLAQKIELHDGSVLEKALAACHYKESWSYVVNVGLKGEDTLVFVIKIPINEFDFPTLEKALSLLMQLHNIVK